MTLSIIITHHRTPELLALCLKSIQENIGDVKHEIIVVDSESKKEIQAPKVVAFKKNLGYSKIVNAGIKQAKGDYILILNADIVVLKDSIQEMIKYMEENPDIGILGPQLLDSSDNIQISCFTNPSLGTILARRTLFGKTGLGKKILRQFTISDWDRKSIRKVDWIQGSAMMVWKKAIKKAGLLDERFFMYFEDVDWCRRFGESGYKVVYFPKAQMIHYYQRRSKKLNKYTLIHIISALKYFWKYL